MEHPPTEQIVRSKWFVSLTKFEDGIHMSSTELLNVPVVLHLCVMLDLGFLETLRGLVFPSISSKLGLPRRDADEAAAV